MLIAISNNIRSHGRAAFAVTAVNVLDNFFALVAAGQVEIDIGPLAAFLRKKPLKEKFHADRVDGGNAKGIADGAVGGRPAALHQNILLAAEADKIPDDQKISREF